LLNDFFKVSAAKHSLYCTKAVKNGKLVNGNVQDIEVQVILRYRIDTIANILEKKTLLRNDILHNVIYFVMR
jgi:hypothetical protein